MRIDRCDSDEFDMLIEDMASIQRVTTDAGNVLYEAPHTKNGHADRAWSLMLGVYAGLNAPTYARF